LRRKLTSPKGSGPRNLTRYQEEEKSHKPVKKGGYVIKAEKGIKQKLEKIESQQ